MSSFASRLRQIDIRSKLIVNGFIRESQKLLPFEDNAYNNLNALIIQICLIYYSIIEYWDKVSPAFITEENGTVLKKITSPSWSNANFGKVIVPSIGICIYEWSLKINKLMTGHAFVGIIDAKCNSTNENISAASRKYCAYLWYGFSGSSGISSQHLDYELKYRTGDEILIRMNTKQGKLEFYKMSNNGKGMELSFKTDYKQDKYLSYKIAATIFYADCITLTKFQVINA